MKKAIKYTILPVFMSCIATQATWAGVKAELAAETMARQAADSNLQYQIDNVELTPGPIGPKGDTGLQGETGLAGSNGTNGIDGANGIDGSNGIDSKYCTAIQNVGSATISCDDGTAASVYDQVGISGNNPGDMKYWNGSEWVLLAAPTSGIANRLSFCNSKPTWERCYVLGDTGPAGGIVFYVSDGGLHGLEVAPEDESGFVEWGCEGTPITGADGTAIGTGGDNTTDILSDCSTADIAAKLARNHTFYGHEGWSLPSIEELNLLYQQASENFLGGFSNEGIYWSSSEINSNSAWAHSFEAGQPVSITKSSHYSVRVIRSF